MAYFRQSRTFNNRPKRVHSAFTVLCLSLSWHAAFAQQPNEIIQQTCIACHNEFTLQAGLNLQNFDVNDAHLDPVVAEKMIRKLRAGQMPPREMPRNDDAIMNLITTLEKALDRHARKNKRAGTRPFQRINRAEYARMVNDLLGLTVDPSEWLPEDQISASFDNIADVQGMSATLMVSYLTAASDIARRAIGQEDAPIQAKTFSNPASVSQHEWERVEGAPYGTRGGISVTHTFPADGDYISRWVSCLVGESGIKMSIYRLMASA